MYKCLWALVGSVMTRYESTTGSTKRYENNLDLSTASEGDRIDPVLIPNSPETDVGERVAYHTPNPNPQNKDDRTYSVRLIAHGHRDQYRDIQSALIYDSDADLFARISGHTHSGAWTQQERDYKVREVGRDVQIVDQWDVEIPDLDEFGETAEEFIATWAAMLFDKVRHGEVPGDELQEFNGQKFCLYDYDGRRARVQYALAMGDDDR